jgi:hypothetical protein
MGYLISWGFVYKNIEMSSFANTIDTNANSKLLMISYLEECAEFDNANSNITPSVKENETNSFSFTDKSPTERNSGGRFAS